MFHKINHKIFVYLSKQPKDKMHLFGMTCTEPTSQSHVTFLHVLVNVLHYNASFRAYSQKTCIFLIIINFFYEKTYIKVCSSKTLEVNLNTTSREKHTKELYSNHKNIPINLFPRYNTNTIYINRAANKLKSPQPHTFYIQQDRLTKWARRY